MTNKATEYEKRLVGSEGRIMVYFEQSRRVVTKFSVQLEINIKNKWTPIRRYDSAHGEPHLHIFASDGMQYRASFPVDNNNEGLTQAIKILTDNYEKLMDNYLTQANKRRHN